MDKISASELAAGQRYVVVENSRSNSTKPLVSFRTLLFLALILSALLTITLALMRNIWSNETAPKGPSEKDVVVLKVELKGPSDPVREIKVPLQLQPLKNAFVEEEV